MVRGRARAFLAGPPLLKAATGEIATDEALGGADMHAARLGPGRVRRRGRRQRAGDRARADRRARLAAARRTGPTAPRRCLAADDLLAPVRRRHEEAGRHAPGDRAHRRRLRLPRVQAPTTARRRSAATPRSPASRSASSPTTARSIRPAAPRSRTSSRAASRRHCRSSGCRTPPASSSAPRPSTPA